MTRVKATPRVLEVAQGVEQRATGAVSGLAGLDASKAYPGVRNGPKKLDSFPSVFKCTVTEVVRKNWTVFFRVFKCTVVSVYAALGSGFRL